MSMHARQLSRDLHHFLELARRGKFPAASGGEQRAHRIAQALLDDAPGLDQDALAGMAVFARLCSVDWNSANRLVEGGPPHA